jgi:hypothetical protein
MTGQVQENLLYNGRSYALIVEPLEGYLEQNSLKLEMISTACRRGYIGSWKIEGSSLYLTKLQDFQGKELTFMDDYFTGHDGAVLADWFSGHLTCPYGGVVEYVPSVYKAEKYMILFLENGKVKDEKYMSLDAFVEWEGLP